MKYKIDQLKRSYKKSDFKCGTTLLDTYLHKQASQDVKRKLTACFVLIDTDKNVMGYYTLSSSGIPREFAPEKMVKKMPPTYSQLPVTLLGRLAVDKSMQGNSYGELLLMDALKKSYEVSASAIGSLAVVVNPIDKKTEGYYKKFGFILLPGTKKMFLEMNYIAKLFE